MQELNLIFIFQALKTKVTSWLPQADHHMGFTRKVQTILKILAKFTDYFDVSPTTLYLSVSNKCECFHSNQI